MLPALGTEIWPLIAADTTSLPVPMNVSSHTCVCCQHESSDLWLPERRPAIVHAVARTPRAMLYKVMLVLWHLGLGEAVC